jgi:hypothetical protein
MVLIWSIEPGYVRLWLAISCGKLKRRCVDGYEMFFRLRVMKGSDACEQTAGQDPDGAATWKTGAARDRNMQDAVCVSRNEWGEGNDGLS